MNYIKDTIEYLIKLFEWWIIVQPWEEGIRVRLGKKVKHLTKGVYLKLPFVDHCYIQTVRLRVLSLPPQTVSTKDGKTLSIVVAIGYSINDINKLYQTLYHPDSTICNMVSGEIADFIYTHDLESCSPKDLQEHVISQLDSTKYGIKYEYIKIIGYAVVKTYRLLQDSHWTPNDLNMNLKS